VTHNPLQIKIIDTTLREGCQAPGVRFDIEQSAAIAAALARLGVDQIECGHPSVSAFEMERVRRVVQLGLAPPVLAHARASAEDIDAVVEAGATWAGIFLGINEVTRRARVCGKSVAELLDSIAGSVSYARRRGLQVRYTLEDATRTGDELMLLAFRTAIEAGANRICYADTVGVAEPDEVAARVRAIKAAFPATELEIHLHDDRGLALANALAGVRAGADWISTSVNGLGERSGITDLCLFLANLYYLCNDRKPPGEEIQQTSALVAAYARAQVDHRRPVTGRHAFVHTAHLHVKATHRDESAYSWLTPKIVGREASTEAARLPETLESLFLTPRKISATELKHHREGPGVRYVMVDERVVADCRQYCIAREIPALTEPPPSHVDAHAHNVDSLFVFIGHEPGLTGLTVEVQLGDVVKELESPVSVFIPAGVVHTYRILKGRGVFINHVLAGSYNESLLEQGKSAVQSR
jgi:2-isopropylmalate synthase